jgi:hypothetical protein
MRQNNQTGIRDIGNLAMPGSVSSPSRTLITDT